MSVTVWPHSALAGNLGVMWAHPVGGPEHWRASGLSPFCFHPHPLLPEVSYVLLSGIHLPLSPSWSDNNSHPFRGWHR